MVDDDRSYFVVVFFIHPAFLPGEEKEEKSSEKKSKKSSGKNSEKGSVKKSKKSSGKNLSENSETSMGKGLGEKPGKKSSGKKPGKSSVKNSEKGSVKKAEKSSEKKSNAILILLRKKSVFTIPELSNELGISTRAVEKQINSLKKAGKLKRRGARKEGWWEVVGEK